MNTKATLASVVVVGMLALAAGGCAQPVEEPVETKVDDGQGGNGGASSVGATEEPGQKADETANEPTGGLHTESYCRTLLRRCLAGSNPRSFSCDSWITLC